MVTADTVSADLFKDEYMKTALSLGVVALLCVGGAHATCGPIMVSPAPTNPNLVIDQPLLDVSAPPWLADQVYQKGDIVMHTNGIYQARWWTQNEEPGPAWASWELLTQENAQWRSEAVYNQGDQVLHEGKIYQAQYWTQGQNPSNGGPWLETQTSQKLRAANFIQESYDCGAPPQYNPDGSYYYTRHYMRSISLATEVTDEIIFDTVRFANNFTGRVEPVTAVIDGQTCQGQAACNALLDGEEKQVSYYSLATKSWSKTYGTVMPTPTPQPTFEPTPSYVPRIATDELGERTMQPPTYEPTPPPQMILVCNNQDICRQVMLN